MDLAMNQIVFNGQIFNDDRMFIMHLCRCCASVVGNLKVVTAFHDQIHEDCQGSLPSLNWCVLTYRNTPNFEAFKVNVFAELEEAQQCLAQMEPTTPLVSNGGDSPQRPLRQDFYKQWKKQNSYGNYPYRDLFPSHLNNLVEHFFEDNDRGQMIDFGPDVLANSNSPELSPNTHVQTQPLQDPPLNVSNPPRGQREIGMMLMEHHHYRHAIPVFLHLIDQTPNDWSLHYMVGQCFRFAENYDGAIKYLRQATSLNDEEVQGFMALGIALQLAGQFDEAIKAFRRAIEIEPKDHNAYNSLGLTYKKIGDIDKAIEEYSKAAEIICVTAFEQTSDSFMREMTMNGERTLCMMPGASEASHAVLRSTPSYAIVMSNIGACLMEKGDFQNARDRFLESISCTPEGYDYSDPHAYLEELDAMNH